MEDGFRVQSIAIEGFKGFTKRQEIDLKGQHTFLLGKNGNGKSSILEAIRWGLFGSPRGTIHVVANWDYTGPCRVEVSMMRDSNLWHLRRTVLRGVTGGNDYRLTDAQGVEHLLGEVMPQLDSVDAGEGMHIIFAPQSEPLRRQADDLSVFERTVFNHMGLTHPRSLLSQVEKFIDEQQAIEDDLGKNFDGFQDEVDKQIDFLQRQRGIILSTPPWDSDQVPSVAESENGVRAVIKAITAKDPDRSLAGVSLDALIESAEDSLKDKRAQDQESLENELATIAERNNQLLELSEGLAALNNEQSQIQQSKSRLEEALGDKSLDELRNQIDEARDAADTATLKIQIINQASALIQRDQLEPASCPICEAEHDRNKLLMALRRTADQLSGASAAELNQMENSLSEAESLATEIDRHNTSLGNLSQNVKEGKERIDADDPNGLSDSVTVDEINSKLEQHKVRQDSIQEQIKNQEGWLDSVKAQLSKFREEEKYHKIQKDLVEIEHVKNQLNQVGRAYQDFVSFGESVQSIQVAISTCLVERLEKEIPGVSDALSKVYAALTQHPWYDRLTIAKDMLPKLELRIASSSDPSGLGHPAAVLNGQAESALALVPYFAFSQDDNNPTEVYLVLLDDPTRSFDADHIEILVEELAMLGKHVQLVVASQESDKFRELLPKYFDHGSYQIIEPKQWSHDDGPVLTIE